MPNPLPEISTPQVVRVEVWKGNKWEIIPYLNCLNLRRSVQPSTNISTATLEYKYGEIAPAVGPSTFFTLVHKLGTSSSAVPDLLDSFVRIGVGDTGTGTSLEYWCGVITAVDDRDRTDPNVVPGHILAHEALADLQHDLASPHPYGTQVIQVKGPEHVLNRKQIVTSRVGELANLVQRGLPFNFLTGRLSEGSAEQQGNKHKALTAFTLDMDTAKAWTASAIALYLDTDQFPTKFTQGGPTLSWLTVNRGILEGTTPVIDAHGKSCFQVLNQLVDPRKFTHYWIRYTWNPASRSVFGNFEIVFGTSTSSAVNLPGTNINIPGNTNTVQLVTSGSVDGHSSVALDNSQKFDFVVVTGSRRGVVTTIDLSVSGVGILEQGWTQDEEDIYKAGDPGVAAALLLPDPPDESEWEVTQLTFRINTTPNVFTRFVTSEFAQSDLEAIGKDNNIITTDQYLPGLRWKRTMPLKVGWDYSVDPPVPKNGAPIKPEFRKLESLYRYHVGTGLHGDDPHLWAFGSTMGKVLGGNEDFSTMGSVHARPLDDAFGVLIKPNYPAHWQAKNGTTGIAHDVEKYTPAFDWKGDIWITGYFQFDEYTSGQWPAGNLPTDDAEVLYIRLGDIAFYDVMSGFTVVDIENGEIVQPQGNADIIVRDDRPLLNDIARMAAEWYGKTRDVYQISYQQVAFDANPGDILTSVDNQVTDVLVTDVIWNFENLTTQIVTSHAQPDFAQIAREALV